MTGIRSAQAKTAESSTLVHKRKAVVCDLFFVVFGLFEIFAAMKSKSIGFSAWGIGLFSGIVNIVCAIMLFVSPILFSLLVAVFVLWRGVAMIAEGVTVGKIVYR